MLKMEIDDWIARIDRQFDAGLYSDVVVHGTRKTKEITNFEFCLTPQEIFQKASPPDEEELLERAFVLSESLRVYDEYLKNDVNTRQAAFVNNYDGHDNHCISYFHHYVRDNKYCLNIYVRSLNYKANFKFDCQTFNLIYAEVFKKIKEAYPKVEQGYIRVFVFSLHNYE